MPNYIEYQQSISRELISIKDRVRNFIDNHHWGEDGRYKEIIRSHVLRATSSERSICWNRFCTYRSYWPFWR